MKSQDWKQELLDSVIMYLNASVTSLAPDLVLNGVRQLAELNPNVSSVTDCNYTQNGVLLVVKPRGAGDVISFTIERK